MYVVDISAWHRISLGNPSGSLSTAVDLPGVPRLAVSVREFPFLLPFSLCPALFARSADRLSTRILVALPAPPLLFLQSTA